ncbi:MAG: dihydroorotase family protein [Nitrospinota bacterium]
MTTHDTVISGGVVVTPECVGRADIGIQDGKISAIEEPGKLNAHERIDASDKLVLPGLVDVHVHLRDPGFTHKEDFSSGTAEAAAGGVTTLIAQPNTNPPATDAESLRAVRRRGEGSSRVDFGMAGMALPAEAGRVGEMAAEGAACIEVFMADAPNIFSDERQIREILLAAKDAGLPVAVYAVDSELASLHREKIGKRRDPVAQADARPNVTEAAAILKILLMAQEINAPVNFRQVSTKEGIGLLRIAKASGIPVGVEVNPHHLFLTRSDLTRLGPFAAVYPPLRSREDVAALWAAIRDGTVDWVATDHAPHAPAEKEAGKENIFDAPGGLPGLRTLLLLLLNAVYRTRLELSRAVELLCTGPARRFGFFEKGEIRVGADADLVIADMNLELTPKERPVYTKARVSPYDSLSLKGWPVRTLLRGRTVAIDGEICGEPSGRFLRPQRE